MTISNLKKDTKTYLIGIWNTNFWQILMIFLLLDINCIARFEHPCLLNLGHFRPLFFAIWRIFLIHLNRRILPPRTAGVPPGISWAACVSRVNKCEAVVWSVCFSQHILRLLNWWIGLTNQPSQQAQKHGPACLLGRFPKTLTWVVTEHRGSARCISARNIKKNISKIFFFRIWFTFYLAFYRKIELDKNNLELSGLKGLLKVATHENLQISCIFASKLTFYRMICSGWN